MAGERLTSSSSKDACQRALEAAWRQSGDRAAVEALWGYLQGVLRCSVFLSGSTRSVLLCDRLKAAYRRAVDGSVPGAVRGVWRRLQEDVETLKGGRP